MIIIIRPANFQTSAVVYKWNAHAGYVVESRTGRLTYYIIVTILQ